MALDGRPTQVTCKHGDRTFSGQWYDEGREICVASAYGSRRAAVGRRQPARLAAQLMGEIVEEWAELKRKGPPRRTGRA